LKRLAVALDLGTSGFRAQALEALTGKVLSTAISTHHPLPGANVIDHLHFALELGIETTRSLVLKAINQLLGQLQVSLGDVARLAVCGNPTQLSLFQGMEIRDLAFAGSRKLEALGISVPDRAAAIRSVTHFPGLDLPSGCEIIIPPAVHDEIGADTLALIIKSGISQCHETAIAIDYGTNAEMALFHQGGFFTASAAAGPALEGQHISCGTLAVPGAIADLEPEGQHHRLRVLDDEMQPTKGALIDLCRTEAVQDHGDIPAKAITGTGVIAAIHQALERNIITLPHILTDDRQLHFGKDICLTETDLDEAGKAIGAIRAGYFTLGLEAGISPEKIRIAFLAGASGSYVDASKSWRLGLIPPCVQRVTQLGNTSLAMARELALRPSKLTKMTDLSDSLRATHCMFAASHSFSRIFLLELSYWTEGMPMETYREMLHRFHLPDLAPLNKCPTIIPAQQPDIGDFGALGLVTLEQIGAISTVRVEGCLGCLTCIERCPSDALSIDITTQPPQISLTQTLCSGVACRRCELVCEPKVFHLNDFYPVNSV
jgi:methylamine methyltransferase corrinoid protein reductive activase